MIAVAYAGGFFSDVSGVSRSNGLMTARITLVATCAERGGMSLVCPSSHDS